MKPVVKKQFAVSMLFVLVSVLLESLLFSPIYYALHVLFTYALKDVWRVPLISFFRDVGIRLTVSQIIFAFVCHLLAFLIAMLIVLALLERWRGEYIAMHEGIVYVREAAQNYFLTYTSADGAAFFVFLPFSLLVFAFAPPHTLLYDVFSLPCFLYDSFGYIGGIFLFLVLYAGILPLAVIITVNRWRRKMFNLS